MSNYLVGKHVPPWLVGLIRAIIYAVLSSAIGAIIYFLNGDQMPAALLPYAPLLLALFRTIEASIDQALKPRQNAVVPPKV